MMKKSRFKSQKGATDLVLANAVDFLNAGISILFSPNTASREAKVAIVSIQTAIELLAKYRLVNDFGLRSIIRGKVPLDSLEDAARSGKFHTIGYSECLKKIKRDEVFTASEDELVRELQDLRNALVHFAADVDLDEVRMSAAWLIIRGLSMFAAGQGRDQGEFQNHRRFLSESNFLTLTQFPPYRDESVDAALDSVDTEDVLRCWECKVDALSLRLSETYFCHCCGLTVGAEVAAFTNCCLCGAERGVCYDPNNSENGLHRGKCLYCGKFVWVWICRDCGLTRSQEGGHPPSSCLVCAE